jgi:hypothetical protein
VIRFTNKRNGNQPFNITKMVISDITSANPVNINPQNVCRVNSNDPFRLPASSGRSNQLTVTCLKPKASKWIVHATSDVGGDTRPVQIPESPQAEPAVIERVVSLESAVGGLKSRADGVERQQATIAKGLTVNEAGDVTVSNQLFTPKNQSDECQTIVLNASQRVGNNVDYCPTGYFMRGFDVDDVGNVPTQSSPLPNRVQCCRP